MAEDDFSLGYGDPCTPTLQAYKQYLTPLIDDYWQVNQYEAYAPDFSRWQQCCPGSAASVARLRPDKKVIPSLDAIPLPPVFGKGGPCARAIYDQGFFTTSGLGELWRSAFSRQRKAYWADQYVSVRDQLHSCCVDHFNACLKEAGRQSAPGGAATAEASSECLRRFSPDQQQLATATPAAAERAACAAKLEELSKQHSQAVAELSQSADRLRQSDAQLCNQRVEAAEAAGKQAAEQQAAAALARAQEVDRTRAGLRSCEASATEVQAERDRLQATLAKIVVHPGSEVLAAFPTGIGSPELVLVGGCALAAGFLVGLPGWSSRWAKLGAGTLGAFLAFLVYVSVVALLPDTKWPHLLLAFAAGLLLTCLAALGRLFFLLQRHGAAGKRPEDGAGLDAAEAALVERWRDPDD